MKQNKIFNIVFNGLIYLTISLLVAILLDRIFILNHWGQDDFEHLLAAMFIHNGYHPYTDYFQHHHPLLWYMLSPLFNFVEHPIETYFIARVLMGIIWGIGCIFMGLIIKKMGGGALTFLYTLLIYLTFAPCHGIYIQNRPDTPMITCLLAGIYFWIAYYQKPKLKYLITCYLLFWISFAFLQKAVWILFPFGCYQFILLFQKKLKLSHFLWALFIPVVLSIGYFVYLYQTDALARYWELNWVLNKYWFRDYQMYDYEHITILYFVSTLVSLIYIAFKKEGLPRHLSGIALFLMGIYIIIPKPYEFYWLMPAVVSALTLGFVLTDLLQGKVIPKVFATSFLTYVLLIGNLYIFIPTMVEDADWDMMKQIYNETPQNEIIGSYGDFLYSFNITYPIYYYYFSMERGALWDIDLFHKHPLPDWNDLIYKTKPRYVLDANLLNCKNAGDDDCSEKLMGPDKQFLSENYKLIKLRVWKRKW